MSKVEQAIDVMLSGWQQWLSREPNSAAAKASVEAAQAMMRVVKSLREEELSPAPVAENSSDDGDREVFANMEAYLNRSQAEREAEDAAETEAFRQYETSGQAELDRKLALEQFVRSVRVHLVGPGVDIDKDLSWMTISQVIALAKRGLEYGSKETEYHAEIDQMVGHLKTGTMGVDPVMQFFGYKHLSEDKQAISKMFCSLALTIFSVLPDNAERGKALDRLLEAKDAAVRSSFQVTTNKRK